MSRRFFVFVALPVLLAGCGRRVVEYSLADALPVPAQPSAMPAAVAASLPNLPPSEPASEALQEAPRAVQQDSAPSISGGTSGAASAASSLSQAASAPQSSSGSPFFIAPSGVNARTIGQLLLRHGQSHDEPLCIIAAVGILAAAHQNPSEPQIQLWKKHLDLAGQAAHDNVLAGLLAAQVRARLDSQQPTLSRDGTWKVGLHRFTPVGLGEIVSEYGETTNDHLAHLVGILILAKAERQAGIPSAAELNGKVEAFLNRVSAPIWVRLASHVTEVIDRRAIRELQQRPGEDWPSFLGPTGDGSAQEVQLIKQWPDAGPPVVWELDAGKGFAACSIQGGLLYLFDRVGDYNRLLCVDQETGQVLGKTFAYPAPDVAPGGYRGPRSSPVIDGDRVYVLDETGLLHCVRAGTSDVIWRVDTSRDFGVEMNQFGVAATPMIVDDLLILVVGGGSVDTTSKNSRTRISKPNGSALAAFEKETGKVAYAAGKYLADYASPVLTTIDGVPWGLAFLREGLVGFAPHSGRIVADFPWRAADLASVNAASPVVAGNEVFISNGFGQGSALLAINPGDFTPVWTDDPDAPEKRFEAYFSTPVYHDGYLYGCSGKDSHTSDLRCIEWRTGKLMWKEEGLNRVSLIHANGQLICLTEYGELLLIDAVPDDFRLVSSVTLQRASSARQAPEFRVPSLLEYPCWAAPVLSRGYLYLRSPDKLVCLDILAPESERPEVSPPPAVEPNVVADTDDAPMDSPRQTDSVVEQASSEASQSISVESDEGDEAPSADESAQPPSDGKARATLTNEPVNDVKSAEQPKAADDDSIDAANATIPEAPPEPEAAEPAEPQPPAPAEEDKDTNPAGAAEDVDGQPSDTAPQAPTRSTPKRTPPPASDLVRPEPSQPLIGYRIWRNAQGRRLDAAIVSFNGDTVVFRLRNGRARAYPFAELSEADQELIINASRTANDQPTRPVAPQPPPPLESESDPVEPHPNVPSEDASSPRDLAVTEIADRKPFLGIRGRDAKSTKVDRVYRGSVAERLGVRPGDVLFSINGEQVDDFTELHRILETLVVGDLVRVEVVRDGVIYELRPAAIGTRSD